MHSANVDGENNKSDRASGDVRFEQTSPGELRLSFAGNWRLQDRRPSAAALEQQFAAGPAPRRVSFDTSALAAWDTGLVTYLARVKNLCDARNIEIDPAGLPEGARRLLQLAFAVPVKKDTGKHGEVPPTVTRIGITALELWRGIPAMLRFTGEATQSLGRFVTGRAQYRRSDLLLVIQDVGPSALPIVSIISFLVGLIVAYMGAVQLAQFGAQIYIANLVGIGMVREMGALMTGIIMAGRTGAAFAAQLGTMQVNEEIDAFKTMGIAPMDFLVLPRMLALILMMPLLTLYSGVVGMLAGLAVAMLVFDIGIFEYYHQTISALDLRQFAVGISKGTVYGILIAIAGCLRGLQCGRSAQAVGQATTSAVVTSIVFIVIAASVLTILYQQLGI
jgi:phospholipid/cholesterol/gamma-HCH transport system permease protein